MTVVDASAFGDLFFGARRDSALFRLLEGGDEIHIPTLCDIEVTSTLFHLEKRRLIAVDRMRSALSDYLDLPLQRHGHLALLNRVLDLRHNFTAYDAVYVALSEALDAPLLTADARLARAVRAHSEIRVLPEE